MTKYQVTALFGNVFEVVGEDEVGEVEAHRLFNLYRNSGRAVNLWLIGARGGRLIKQANQ